MKWKSALVAACVVLVTASGCAREAPADGSLSGAGTQPSPELSRGDEMPGRKPAEPVEPGDRGESAVPAPPPEDREGTDVPESRIDASGLPEGYPVDVATTGDGSTLRVIGQEGGCSRASAELAQEGRDRVTIRMVETKPSDPTQVCTMDMRYPPLTVELAEPLGDRDVVLTYEQRTS